jgi:hypothetical protein
LYIAGLHTDLSGLSADEAKQHGDLNGDFTNDFQDFLLFKQAFDAANGAGAFATSLQAPEPGAFAMAVGGLSALLSRRVTMTRGTSTLLISPIRRFLGN